MVLFFNLCLVLLGLTLPGFLLARQLRCRHAWAAAFPLSSLFIAETVIVFSMTGIPIRFSTMCGALLFCAVCCLASEYARRPALPEDLSLPQASSLPEASDLPPRFTAAILLLGMTLLIILAVRTTLFPLRGLDTSFRWEGLARAMLQQQSLDFYPPVSAADFSIYLYPDGIPPLVASVYWWIYATLGVHLPQATTVSLVLQLAATMALSFFGASHLFGRQAGWFTLLAISSCPLLFNGFAIGQETGFTALAVAGQICFAAAAVRKPGLSPVILAALFAALGSLARDYGPALALTGFVILAWHSATRRYLLFYTLITVCFSAPWYLRSWVLTGNPFFSHALPGGFYVNAIHAEIMRYYSDVFAFSRLDLGRWLSLAKQLFTGAALAICVGLPYALLRWRRVLPLLVTVTIVTLLWLVSVGQTAGGVIYSTRVLTPAAVALSICAGLALSRLYCSTVAEDKRLRPPATVGLFLIAGYTLASAAIYPFPSQYFSTATTSTPIGSIQLAILDKLEVSDFPATGVLTDLPFAAETMLRSSRFRPVMYWSPEVAFVLDANLEPSEIQKRLTLLNIRLVLVDGKSPNNRFLSRTRFFSERGNWSTLCEIENEAAIFYFEPN